MSYIKRHGNVVSALPPVPSSKSLDSQQWQQTLHSRLIVLIICKDLVLSGDIIYVLGTH